MVVERPHSKRYPDSIVFRYASWRFYTAILREYDELPSRINYDRGVLEVMTPSFEHERYKSIVGSLVTQVALAFRIPVAHGGSSTLKRKLLQRGLEADQCYWVQNESLVRSTKRLDLRSDPPPDLVIEIDVMHAVVDRESIYAKLGVPEMWVLGRDGTLRAFKLTGREWHPVEFSLAFPFLRIDDLNRYVARIGVDHDTLVVADFGDWLRTLARPNA